MILILLRPPLAHSQNICVMRRAMTLPNVLNRAILGPPPRSLSICPPPAQQFVLSHKSLALLYSAALLWAATSAPCHCSHLCPMSLQSPPISDQHLCSRWSAASFLRLRWGNSPVISSQSKVFPRAQRGRAHCSQSNPTLHISSSALPAGIVSKSRGSELCHLSTPAQTSSGTPGSSLVPFLFGVTF